MGHKLHNSLKNIFIVCINDLRALLFSREINNTELIGEKKSAAKIRIILFVIFQYFSHSNIFLIFHNNIRIFGCISNKIFRIFEKNSSYSMSTSYTLKILHCTVQATCVVGTLVLSSRKYYQVLSSFKRPLNL
jgi:hypothetical protein